MDVGRARTKYCRSADAEIICTYRPLWDIPKDVVHATGELYGFNKVAVVVKGKKETKSVG